MSVVNESKSKARRAERCILALTVLGLLALCAGVLVGCGSSQRERDLEKRVTELDARVAALMQDKQKVEADLTIAQEDLKRTQDAPRKPQAGSEPTASAAAAVPNQPGPESQTASMMVPEARLDGERQTPALGAAEAQHAVAEPAESGVPPLGTAGTAMPPEVPLQAARPTGIVLVVWIGDQPDGDSRVLARRIAATGEALDPDPLVIASIAGYQEAVSATMGETGWLVVWYDPDSAGEIWGARVTADGAVLDKQAILIASGDSPSVVWGGVGWLVTYVMGSGSGEQLVCQIVGASGKLLLDGPLAWGVTSRTQGSLLTLVAGEGTLEHRLPQCLPGETGYLLLASDYAKQPRSKWSAASALVVAPSGKSVAGAWKTLREPEKDENDWDISGCFGSTRWLVAWKAANQRAGTVAYLAATIGTAESGEPKVLEVSPDIESIDAIASTGATDEWLLVWTDRDYAIKGALVRADCSLSKPTVLIPSPEEQCSRSGVAAVWNGMDYVVSCLEQDESIEQEPCRLLVVRVARNGAPRDTAAPATVECPRSTRLGATALAIAGDSILPAPALTLPLAAEGDGQPASAAGRYFAPLDLTTELELTADGKCRMLTLTKSGDWASGGADLGHWRQKGDAITLSFSSSPGGMEFSGNVTASGLVFTEDYALASWGFFSVVWIREGVLPPIDIGYDWRRVGGDPGEVMVIDWQSYEMKKSDHRGGFLDYSDRWGRDAWVLRFEMPMSSSLTWDYVYLDGRLYLWDMWEIQIWECTDGLPAAPSSGAAPSAESSPAAEPGTTEAPPSVVPSGATVGARAPDFTLESLSGDRVSLSDYQGKIVILDFWASWCAPCRTTMPGLEELAARYKDTGVVLVGVSLDRTAEDATSYLKANGSGRLIPLWGSLAQAREVARVYGIVGVPHTLVIDQQGIIRFSEHPSRLSDNLVESLLQTASAGSPNTSSGTDQSLPGAIDRSGPVPGGDSQPAAEVGRLPTGSPSQQEVQTQTPSVQAPDSHVSLRIGYFDADAAFAVLTDKVKDLRRAAQDKANQITVLQQQFASGSVSKQDFDAKNSQYQAELLQAQLTIDLGTIDKMIAAPGFSDIKTQLQQIREQAQSLVDQMRNLVSTARVGVVSAQEFQTNYSVVQTSFSRLDLLLTQTALMKVEAASQKVALQNGFDLVLKRKDIIISRDSTQLTDITDLVKRELESYF